MPLLYSAKHRCSPSEPNNPLAPGSLFLCDCGKFFEDSGEAWAELAKGPAHAKLRELGVQCSCESCRAGKTIHPLAGTRPIPGLGRITADGYGPYTYSGEFRD